MRYMGGGSVAEGGPRVLVCDGAPEGLSTGLFDDYVECKDVEVVFAEHVLMAV